MKKALLFCALFTVILASSPNANAQALHEKMFDKFGTVAEWMNTPMINSYLEENAALEERFFGLLDESPTDASVTKIFPMGKVESGKNVILLYAHVDYKEDGTSLNFFNIHSQTLSKKSGEIVESEKYLLAGGTRGDMKYNGSFKLKDGDLIIFTQNEVEISTEKETVTVKEYRFKKVLEYVRTIE